MYGIAITPIAILRKLYFLSTIFKHIAVFRIHFLFSAFSMSSIVEDVFTPVLQVWFNTLSLEDSISTYKFSRLTCIHFPTQLVGRIG